MNIIQFSSSKNSKDKRDASPIYLIYAYRDPETVCGQYNAWEMKGAKASSAEALSYAQDLYSRDDFEKVEIYKRCFDQKTQKMQDKLFKTIAPNSFWRLENFF